MRPKRTVPRSSARTTSRPARLELPPDRAFVVHLDADTQPPRRVAGRVEHITSGQVAHVTSWRGLVAFLTKVLRNQVRVERGTAHARRVSALCQSDRAAIARGSLEKDAARAAQPILRGRKRGAES